MTSPPAHLPIAIDVPLAPLTTLGCGGSARWLMQIDRVETARAALAWCRDEGLRSWVLGGGSNVLVADAGLNGLVLVPAMCGRTTSVQKDGTVQVRVEAGHDWDALVDWSTAQGLAGIECLSGIPGRVGAAPIQNIGAYGQSVADCMVAVEALDCATGDLRQWPAAECGFGYRDSLFKRAAPGRFLVTAITLRLRSDGQPTLHYPELRRRLGVGEAPNGGLPNVDKVRQVVLELRRSKGMVVDADEPDSRSAGSFFLNPVVSQAESIAVERRLAHTLRPGETMPGWRQVPVDGKPLVKLSAAWLIERCGLGKGYGEGPVGLSRKHTLAIVNRGGASTRQVLAFAAVVQRRVEDGCGVCLQREPVLLGPDGAEALI